MNRVIKICSCGKMFVSYHATRHHKSLGHKVRWMTIKEINSIKIRGVKNGMVNKFLM